MMKIFLWGLVEEDSVKNMKLTIWGKHIASALVSVSFAVLLGLIVYWMVFNIHTDPAPKVGESAEVNVNISSRLDMYYTNERIEALSGYLSGDDVIHKIYRIEDGMSVPVPKESNYGVVSPDDLGPLLDVIDEAKKCGLIDLDELKFNQDIEFPDYSTISYYFDDSILVIIWKELIDGHEITFSEIKIGDASQFRRKLAGDNYGSGVQYYCTELTSQANAVVGINADFYSFRSLGTTCYDGTIYRTDDTLDTLFIDSNGDFQFLERGNGMNKDELQSYADLMNVMFSVSFGPILIKDGELLTNNTYPIGEVDTNYSRAGIGQLGPLHYLYMTIGFNGRGSKTCTVNEFAQYMFDKGVVNGYNLDGGQTGEIVMNAIIQNHVDFGYERPVSDIIYFATAVPEEEQ